MAPYVHHQHLPFAREPLKSLYVFQRLTTTLFLVPFWTLLYYLLPATGRPRASWSLRQTINVRFTRRIYKVTEVAGVTWGTRDPEQAPKAGSLKETRFEWAEPLREEMQMGMVRSEGERVVSRRVGMYVWPKGWRAGTKDNEIEEPLIGLFFHGGGYCHMSAHESSRTSRIPRRLVRDTKFRAVYAVEYRLLQHAPFPAVLQDAAAAYAAVLERVPGARVALIGDSSGGNLALMLARWIRDTGTLRMPAGLLLLSPSCDISHAFPATPQSYIPRAHADTDYLTDTPEPRALLQRTFLGFPVPSKPPLLLTDEEKERAEREEARLLALVNSEYISPAGPQVLQRYAADEAAGDRVHGRLFGDFPRSLVLCGDAERLEHEVRVLMKAMAADGVEVDEVWAPDAAHDILIMKEGWWDRKVVEEVWRRIGVWVDKL